MLLNSLENEESTQSFFSSEEEQLNEQESEQVGIELYMPPMGAVAAGNAVSVLTCSLPQCLSVQCR